MFDKLKFNNLIISGSKEIQKAKVQIVRKVIQKLQKLKNLAEKQPENESHKIKLRKCLAIVESAKKLKRFEALTSILLLEKTPDKIVTNSNSTPDQVAIAMLASHQIMKPFLTKLRQELNLDDTDLQTLRKTLNEIARQKTKNQKKKKRKQAFEAADADKDGAKLKKTKKDKSLKAGENKIESKPQKAKSKKKVQVQNASEVENEIESKPQKAKAKKKVPVQNASEVENEIESKPQKAKAKKKVPVQNASEVEWENLEKANNVRQIEYVSPEILNENHNDAINDPETSIVKSKSSKTKISKSKFEANATAELEDKLLDHEDSKFCKKIKSEKLNREEETKTEKVLDNVNKKYEEYSKPWPKKLKTECKYTRAPDPFFITTTGESYLAIQPVIETNEKSSNNEHHNGSTFKELKKVSHGKPKPFKAETKNENLHPSWKAKHKQSMPVSFQGKRKTFEDSRDNKSKNSDKSVELHPSWVAKQKLKPTITAFQGKKIKFDDA